MFDWHALANPVVIFPILVGFVISLFFYRMSTKRKILSYSIERFTFISSDQTALPGIVLTYYDKEIDELYSTNITIYNSGNCMIEPTDFSIKQPLSIEITGEILHEDEQSLHAYILEQSEGDMQLSIKEEKGSNICLLVDFEFLRKKDEISLNLLHTGNVNIKGKMKDGVIKSTDSNNELRRKTEIIFGVAVASLAIVISLCSVLVTPPSEVVAFFIIILIVIFIIFICMSFRNQVMRKPFKVCDATKKKKST